MIYFGYYDNTINLHERVQSYYDDAINLHGGILKWQLYLVSSNRWTKDLFHQRCRFWFSMNQVMTVMILTSCVQGHDEIVQTAFLCHRKCIVCYSKHNISNCTIAVISFSIVVCHYFDYQQYSFVATSILRKAYSK